MRDWPLLPLAPGSSPVPLSLDRMHSQHSGPIVQLCCTPPGLPSGQSALTPPPARPLRPQQSQGSRGRCDEGVAARRCHLHQRVAAGERRRVVAAASQAPARGAAQPGPPMRRVRPRGSRRLQLGECGEGAGWAGAALADPGSRVVTRALPHACAIFRLFEPLEPEPRPPCTPPPPTRRSTASASSATRRRPWSSTARSAASASR